MTMREIVLRCRERLAKERQRARVSHDAGTPGRQIATVLSNLYDDIIVEVFEDAMSHLDVHRKNSHLALLAHGGYGRCDVSPYSDADLMLLTDRGGEAVAADVAGRLNRDLADIGIDPGLAIRRGGEACTLAWTDPRVFTSLTEVRLIAGSYSGYRRFYERFRRGAMRRHQRIIADVVEARQTERRKWGETAYMLRPNVKRSRGGLRDIQSIRWIGFARYGETDLTKLVRLGLLPAEDFRLVQTAYDFFLSVRHDLHFRLSKASDVLDRHLQLDLAQSWGYADGDGILAVEKFMQDYFENARNVRYALAYCVEELAHRSLLASATEVIRSSRIDEDIRMGPTRIWVARHRLEAFVSSLTRVLNLMALANQYDRRIDHQTWRSIRNSLKSRTLQKGPLLPVLSERGIDAFKVLMGQPTRLAPLLRRMHDLRIIEWLIPQFARLRGMLQFNAYHKYTVDAHSIRAVEAATSLADEPDESSAGSSTATSSREDALAGLRRRYRRIEPKWLFHLTLLIHDIGKGFDEDHCIVGERMAHQIGDRLGLSDSQTDLMAWLVRHHLLVNDFAFRHDLNDPQIVLEFAKEVGTIQRLEWLTVHTVADLMAVGPDVATDWKLGLIEDLYRRTRRYFDSQSLPGSPNDPEIESQRQRLTQSLATQSLPMDLESVIESVPHSLLARHSLPILTSTITAALRMRDDEHLWCNGEYDETAGGVHFVILRREGADRIGTFSQAAGAISALGLSILRAQIERFDEFAWNDFWVHDPMASEDVATDDQARRDRINDLTRRIEELLRDDPAMMPAPPQRWGAPNRNADLNVLPSKVTFDNETIDRFTILSLFAYDSPSLLYRVTKVLADHGLVLQFAKIDTHFDQVADVFYVTESSGGCLVDSDRHNEIREAILEVVQDLSPD